MNLIEFSLVLFGASALALRHQIPSRTFSAVVNGTGDLNSSTPTPAMMFGDI